MGPRGARVSAMTKPVYITSASCSGSTPLTFLFGAHPDIATAGELKAIAMGDIEEQDGSCGAREKPGVFKGDAPEYGSAIARPCVSSHQSGDIRTRRLSDAGRACSRVHAQTFGTKTFAANGFIEP